MWVELIHSHRFETFLETLVEGIRHYFRVEVEGLENIPKTGPVLVVPNHSGFAGADAILLSHILRQDGQRPPRILAHRAYFDWLPTREIAESFGLRRASLENGVELLKQGELLLVFPEGEAGNFKSSLEMYHLQRFHTGFARMAILAHAPIVPCLIVGAEESHLNAGNLNFEHYLKGLRIPLPLNLLPLPARWKIRFLPPIDLSTHSMTEAEDPREMRALSSRIRAMMKRRLEGELKHRRHVFI